MKTVNRRGAIVEIRAVGTTDSRIVAHMTDAESTEPWSVAAVQRILGLPGCWGLLAVEPDGAPVGCLIARVAGGEGEILNLVVVEDARRSGVGRKLVNAALKKARQCGATMMFLEVSADNAAGHALYISAGFCRVGTRADYYRTSRGDYTDALIMKRATV